MQKINLFIRSAFFSIISIIIIFIASVNVMLAVILPLSWRFKVARFYLRIYLKCLELICGITHRVSGLENIPKDKVGIVMSKHSSAWETFYLPIIFKDPAIIAKRELLWVPFFGWALAVSDPITINRSKTSSAMQQVIKKGKAALAAGRWILIFPEGTRIPFGQVGKYKLGGARLAVSTNYPIIPVAHNAGKFWAKRKFIKRPGTVEIIIGKPVEPLNLEPAELTEEVKSWIESHISKM